MVISKPIDRSLFGIGCSESGSDSRCIWTTVAHWYLRNSMRPDFPEIARDGGSRDAPTSASYHSLALRKSGGIDFLRFEGSRSPSTSAPRCEISNSDCVAPVSLLGMRS